MDGRAILRNQIQGMADKLKLVGNALKCRDIDSELSRRVSVVFQETIKRNEDDLGRVSKDVDEGLALDSCWDSLRDLREQCEPLFRECLTFIQGALLRKVLLADRTALDGRACEMADALLADLSHRTDVAWERFTMLAEQEFFYEMAEIIRLRFPDVSIWDLPVAAHEFGHFLGPRIQVKKPDGSFTYPFQDLLDRERRKDQEAGDRQPAGCRWSFLHEQFADIFATYSMGPAFGCTCLLLRFDPGRADQERYRHPTDAARSYIILSVLKKMNEAEGPIVRASQRDVIDRLEQLWRQALADSNKPSVMDRIATPELDELIDELYFILDSRKPMARYTGWLRAQRLAEGMQMESSEAVNPEKGDSLADVLNAAWLARIYSDGDLYKVRDTGRKAVKLYLAIMGSR